MSTPPGQSLCPSLEGASYHADCGECNWKGRLYVVCTGLEEAEAGGAKSHGFVDALLSRSNSALKLDAINKVYVHLLGYQRGPVETLLDADGIFGRALVEALQKAVAPHPRLRDRAQAFRAAQDRLSRTGRAGTEAALAAAAIRAAVLSITLGKALVAANPLRAAVGRGEGADAADAPAAVVAALFAVAIGLAYPLARSKRRTLKVLQAFAAESPASVRAAILAFALRLALAKSLSAFHAERAIAAASVTAVISALLPLALGLAVNIALEILPALVVRRAERTLAAAAVVTAVLAFALRNAGRSRVHSNLGNKRLRQRNVSHINLHRYAGSVVATARAELLDYPDTPEFRGYFTKENGLIVRSLVNAAGLLSGKLAYFVFLFVPVRRRRRRIGAPGCRHKHHAKQRTQCEETDCHYAVLLKKRQIT